MRIYFIYLSYNKLSNIIVWWYFEIWSDWVQNQISQQLQLSNTSTSCIVRLQLQDTRDNEVGILRCAFTKYYTMTDSHSGSNWTVRLKVSALMWQCLHSHHINCVGSSVVKNTEIWINTESDYLKLVTRLCSFCPLYRAWYQIPNLSRHSMQTLTFQNGIKKVQDMLFYWFRVLFAFCLVIGKSITFSVRLRSGDRFACLTL